MWEVTRVGGMDPRNAEGSITTGTPVEVFVDYEQDWTQGFEVAEVASDGYRLRRVGDGQVLPAVVPVDHVRRPYGPGPNRPFGCL
jgi:hypothetical protein